VTTNYFVTKKIPLANESMKNALQIFCIFIFRTLERRLSVRNLYLLLLPLAWTRAALTTTFKKNNSLPLPECLQVKCSLWLKQQQRTAICINNVVDYFPDQLATAKWQRICRINGLEHIQSAQKNGRPVVLAFAHFGPFWSIRAWLRSVEIPMAALVGGKIENRPSFRRRLDKFIPLPEIPTVFYLDQLRKISAFLAAGNILGVAIDARAKKQMTIPFCEGWTFRMATGALRMAIHHQAELIPCLITDDGDWHFRLELGWPTPKEFLRYELDWPRAGKHILNEMMPHLLTHPEQCQREFISCLQKNSVFEK
jgi:hypothetical protein